MIVTVPATNRRFRTTLLQIVGLLFFVIWKLDVAASFEFADVGTVFIFDAKDCPDAAADYLFNIIDQRTPMSYEKNDDLGRASFFIDRLTSDNAMKKPRRVLCCSSSVKYGIA